MTKITFIESLKQGLLKHHVHDIDDILTDYEDYFNEQLNLGKSEEDIAKRLGDVKSIIKDYTNSKEQQHKKHNCCYTSCLVTEFQVHRHNNRQSYCHHY